MLQKPNLFFSGTLLLVLVWWFAHDPRRVHSLALPKPSFRGGAGVGRLVTDTKAGEPNAYRCHYDMVLVERIQKEEVRRDQDSGLYVPKEDLPRLHLCRVLSMGQGEESENGRILPMPDIQIGDVVIAKNPWGIGPKDEETTDGKKLSYMRSRDIAAVIPGGLLSS